MLPSTTLNALGTLNKLKRHKTIRVFEGFAGYGGASFALKRSGLKYKVVASSEYNKFASNLLVHIKANVILGAPILTAYHSIK